VQIKKLHLKNSRFAPLMQPKTIKTMFRNNFFLNRKQRERIKNETTEKAREYKELVFDALSETEKLIHVTPEQMDLKKVVESYPGLNRICNAIYLLEWYHRYLSHCPDEVDMHEPTIN